MFRFDVLGDGIGYVDYVDSWGSDAAIIEAARMSTGKGFLGWGGVCPKCPGTTQTDPTVTQCVHCHDEIKPFGGGDEKLLRFLYENKHATPFEMAGFTIEVKAPIFVFREWHRHRTQSYNEMSARYIPLPDENYIPSVERVMTLGRNGTNKQGGGDNVAIGHAENFIAHLKDSYAYAQECYERALAFGIPKELARLPVPVARYSRMRASANLRNWLGFLTLRMDTKAQWEIRQYAMVVASLVQQKFPRTYELFAEGKNY